MLINNNDRNEDNWGVIKYKKENKYCLAPIFDNGNSFYSKTDEIRIIEILKDETKLNSSAINGITAYENDEEKRLNMKDILKLDNIDFKKSLVKIYNLFLNNFIEVESFIYSIPEFYNDVLIISNERKDYYLKTIKIRLDKIKTTLNI